MFKVFRTVALGIAVAAFSSLAAAATGDHERENGDHDESIQLGPRPFYLVEGMDQSPLKDKLMRCFDGPFRRTDFSIAHRGGALQFPEHTRQAYQGGARMGAGIVECDTTFTKDAQLVCRHAENDLHTTTNILVTPLAAKCTKPFTPATFFPDGTLKTSASAECRTSDLTLAEFKTLTGKMDSSNPAAKTPEEFQGGTAPWRTEIYTGRGPGNVMTLKESIELNESNGVKHTPELKESVVDPNTGKKRIDDLFKFPTIRTPQQNYAQAFADVLQSEGVRPRNAFPQSFNVEDILYWIDNTSYGQQAVYLLDYDAALNDIIIQPPYNSIPRMQYFNMLKQRGVKIFAPAMPALLAIDGSGKIVPSQLAKDIKGLGFDIITWTFERADLRKGAGSPDAGNFYFDFDPTGIAIKKDSDMYKALDVLAQDVKILGIFSDWPATVTFYANCMGLK